MSAKILFNQMETRLFKAVRNVYMAPEAIAGAAKVQQDEIKKIVENFELGMSHDINIPSTKEEIDKKYDEAKKRIDEVAQKLGDDSKDFVQGQVKKLGEVKDRYAATLTALEADKEARGKRALTTVAGALISPAVFLLANASDAQKKQMLETAIVGALTGPVGALAFTATQANAPRESTASAPTSSPNAPRSTVAYTGYAAAKNGEYVASPSENTMESKYEASLKNQIRALNESKAKVQKATAKQEGKKIVAPKDIDEDIKNVNTYLEKKDLITGDFWKQTGKGAIIGSVVPAFGTIPGAIAGGASTLSNDMEWEGDFSADEDDADEAVTNYKNDARSATAGYVLAMIKLGKNEAEITTALRKAYLEGEKESWVGNQSIHLEGIAKSTGVDLNADYLKTEAPISMNNKFYIATLVNNAKETFGDDPDALKRYEQYVKGRLDSATKQLKELNSIIEGGVEEDQADAIYRQESFIIDLIDIPKKWKEAAGESKSTTMDKKIGAAKAKLYEFYLREDPGRWQEIPDADEKGKFKIDKDGNICKDDDGYYVFNKDTNKFDPINMVELKDPEALMGNEELPPIKIAGLGEGSRSTGRAGGAPGEPNEPDTRSAAEIELEETEKRNMLAGITDAWSVPTTFDRTLYPADQFPVSDANTTYGYRKVGEQIQRTTDGGKTCVVYNFETNKFESPSATNAPAEPGTTGVSGSVEGGASSGTGGGSGVEGSKEQSRDEIREELQKESEKNDFDETDNKFYKYDKKDGTITFKGDGAYEMAIRLCDICDLICPNAKTNGCEVTHGGVTVVATWNEGGKNFYNEKNLSERVKIYSGDTIKERTAEEKHEDRSNPVEGTRAPEAGTREPEKAPETITEVMQKVAKGSLQEWLEMKTHKDVDPNDTSDSRDLYIGTTLDAVEANSNVSNELVTFTADKIAKRGIEATNKDVRDSLRAVKSMILDGQEYQIDLTNENSVEVAVKKHLLYLEAKREEIKKQMEQTVELLKKEGKDNGGEEAEHPLYLYVREHDVPVENSEKMVGVLKHAINEEIAKFNSDSIVKIGTTPELYVQGFMKNAVEYYRNNPKKMEEDYEKFAEKE